jgi:anthranilate synthase/aminodeoxychorismate synthase-like glutamine amidotransferase
MRKVTGFKNTFQYVINFLMILLIDNYDSFTYNLYQYIAETGEKVAVRRNDEIDVEEIKNLRPEGIVISPGPCGPSQAGNSVKIIRALYKEFPILGVCLGHQCIAFALGGDVVRARRILHGKTSLIHHDGRGVFEGLKNPFVATRYHSLIVDENSLPDELIVSARAEPDEVMGIRHRVYPLEGVQFHPESILTEEGKKIVRNFLKICKK